MIRVTIWNEYIQDVIWQGNGVIPHYPFGIHKYLESFLKEEFQVTTVTQFDGNANLNENAGITQELLDNTDVMLWWGHCKHSDVPDGAVQMISAAVRSGMGIIFLHSAHHSKPFKALLGTSCNLHWREDGDFEKLWNIAPNHPITQGIGEYIYLPHEEVYSEPFALPQPDEIVFIASYEGGEVFRAGCCWQRECGKIFYFQPGHEGYPHSTTSKLKGLLKMQ